MKRRDFIRNISLASLAIPNFSYSFDLDFITKKLLLENIPFDDRILILIRLNGGNDGLNTLIPLDYYDQLMIHRSKVILPEKSIIKITDNNGLHPSMSKIADLFQEDKIGIIQNVGYQNQNRSHFRSTDIWSTGVMDSKESTGWIGRYFDSNYQNFPQNYPNENYPDPFALSMGFEVSSTCQGVKGNFSHTASNPEDLTSFELSSSISNNTYYSQQLNHLDTIIRQTNAYSKQISTAYSKGTSNSDYYNLENNFSKYLSTISKLISGGLKTRFYVLTINGFDTHGDQLNAEDTTKGTHSDLLKTLSDGIHSFMKDIEKQNLHHKVIGFTFSEFGRQIATNENNGTDHGDSGPMFLFGHSVNPQILGNNPIIEKEIEDQAGVPFEFDFRDVYGSILYHWFGIEKTKIEGVFNRKLTLLDLIKRR